MGFTAGVVYIKTIYMAALFFAFARVNVSILSDSEEAKHLIVWWPSDAIACNTAA